MKRSCQRQTTDLLLPVCRIRRQQDDPGAPNMLLRAVPVAYDRSKSPAIGSLHVHHDPFAHPTDSHACKPSGILKGTRSSGRYH
jgi:hypothetical protein